MTRLRNQLDTARLQYQSARFPGDVTELLPNPGSSSRSFWRSIARGGLVAAALALVVFGHIMLSASEDRSRGSTAWIEDVAKIDHLPWHSTAMMPPSEGMMGAGTTAPSQLPDWLKAVEQPLADSGRFVVSVGKDIVHQADALVHMM